NRTGTNSLRHENCCDDIFEFAYTDFIVIAVTGQVVGITDSSFYKSIEHDYKKNQHLNFENITDTSQIEVLYDYPVSLFKKDQKTGKDVFIKTGYTTGGHYFFNLEQGVDYHITVKDYNQVEKRIDFTTKPITYSDTIVLDAILINTFPNQPIVVNNIYYEFGLSRLTDKAKITIDETIYQLMTNYQHIVVEISSHTDSVASDDFNMRLSHDRAQSVVDYLIQKGIDKERLVAKGYGKNRPIAPNSNPDGTDNPEGRAKNRRTEFKVIGTIEDYSDIIYEE
ncbi:MAG: OmpA family protein, partial [Bacteroidales bacterium]|nr:OmpA family protein [Bacteroidales bacterium]